MYRSLALAGAASERAESLVDLAVAIVILAVANLGCRRNVAHTNEASTLTNHRSRAAITRLARITGLTRSVGASTHPGSVTDVIYGAAISVIARRPGGFGLVHALIRYAGALSALGVEISAL